MPKKKTSKTTSTTTSASTRSAFKIVKDKPMTKTEMVRALAEMTGLTRKKVTEVFQGLEVLMGVHLSKGAIGKFILPRLLKMYVVRKAATKPRMGRNPFTGEEIMFKAKPARSLIRIKPLKGLKELA